MLAAYSLKEGSFYERTLIEGAAVADGDARLDREAGLQQHDTQHALLTGLRPWVAQRGHLACCGHVGVVHLRQRLADEQHGCLREVR